MILLGRSGTDSTWSLERRRRCDHTLPTPRAVTTTSSQGEAKVESNATRRVEVARYFVDENVTNEPKDVLSPSGRFRLTIRTYRTAPGRWNYTRGTVTRVADGAVVCDLQRNYSLFHHSFVTKEGRDYLIAGRSYMSQTIVDLDRGQEFEPPGDHYNGGAFCWARCYLSPDGNTLAVDGCHWAAPYEFRFFDFTDPAIGWPDLPLVGVEQLEHPSDKRAPRWLDDTTFEGFQSDDGDEPQERTCVQRRGREMVVVEHWSSEAEQQRRDDEARADAELAVDRGDAFNLSNFVAATSRSC